MNTWNPELVNSNFDRQALGYITNIDGKVELQHAITAQEIRRLVNEEGASPTSRETMYKALEQVKNRPKKGFPYKQPTFGYTVQWLSELGKTIELNGLLDYANTQLNPTWENGGLFYP
jgi:hypothetical protein